MNLDIAHDCVNSRRQPCKPAEDGVCEALECCKHGVDDGACKECYDDTADHIHAMLREKNGGGV